LISGKVAADAAKRLEEMARDRISNNPHEALRHAPLLAVHVEANAAIAAAE
jgi:hypothetical protein